MLIWLLIVFFIILIGYYLYNNSTTFKEGMTATPISFVSSSTDGTTVIINNTTLATINITWYTSTQTLSNTFTPTNAATDGSVLDPTSASFDITQLKFQGTGPGSTSDTALVSYSSGAYSVVIVSSGTTYSYIETGGTCNFSTNGCCPDGQTNRQSAQDFCGSTNSNQNTCEFSAWGCCSDGVTTRTSATNSSCIAITTTATATATPTTTTSGTTYNHYTGDTYAAVYYGPNGATVYILHTGNTYAIMEKDAQGNTTIYTLKNPTPVTSFDMVIPFTFYATNGATTVIVKNTTTGLYIITITHIDGTIIVYSDTPTTQSSSYTSSMFNSNPGNDGSSTQTPYSNINNPPAAASGIPYGQNDLYILKTQIVPPVCPMCPSCYNCNKKKKKHKKQKQNSSSQSSYQSSSSSSYPSSSANTSSTNCPTCNNQNALASSSSSSVTDFNNTNDSLPMPVMASFAEF